MHMDLTPRRPPQLTPAVKRRVIREATEGETSAIQIRKAPELPVRKFHVHALVNIYTNLQYTTFIRAPVLTPIHVQQSLDWVKEHVT